MLQIKSRHRRCSVKKGVLKNFTNFTGKHQCWSPFFNKVAGDYDFIKKETPTLVFSCEICEIKTPILKNICERLILSNQ